jgi:hypothetical protein
MFCSGFCWGKSPVHGRIAAIASTTSSKVARKPATSCSGSLTVKKREFDQQSYGDFMEFKWISWDLK